MDLKNKLLENTDILIGIIDQMPDSQFNTKPDKDAWSVGDVLEHLYRSEFGLTKLFKGKTEQLSDRTPDALIKSMQERFLESDEKIKASGIILPTEGEKPKKELMAKFRQNRLKIAELVDELYLNELCLLFEHPIYGYLTRLEWIHFSIIHTQRHLKQIERIKSQLK